MAKFTGEQIAQIIQCAERSNWGYQEILCLKDVLQRDDIPSLQMLTSKFNTSNILYAAATHNIAVMELLLQRGVNPDITDDRGFALLHNAIHNEEKSIASVKLLLRHNANVNIPNIAKYTPLHEAAGRGYTYLVELVELLLQYKADVNALTCGRHTPLQVAVDNYILHTKTSIDVVMLLMNNGANVNAGIESHNNALSIAIGNLRLALDIQIIAPDELHKIIQCLMTSKTAVITYFEYETYSQDRSDYVIKALEADPQFILTVCPEASKEKQVAMTKAFELYKVKAVAAFCNELSNLFNERGLAPTLFAFCGDGSGFPVSALEVIPEAISIVGETE